MFRTHASAPGALPNMGAAEVLLDATVGRNDVDTAAFSLGTKHDAGAMGEKLGSSSSTPFVVSRMG